MKVYYCEWDELYDDEVGFYWHVDDVADREEELGVSLTEDQRREVLRRLKKNHDANVGVNWDVIDHWIEHVEEVHAVLARAA